MANDKRWARLQADVDLRIRRGAWYRVLQASDLEVILEVNDHPVSVLRAVVEIVNRPAPRWTVVTAPEALAKKVPKVLGGPYGVCPSCGERAALKKRAKRMPCPSCKWEFEIAWDEGYLAR